MRTERPGFLGVDSLAQLYARGQLPSAPDDPGVLGDTEFGPVGDVAPPEPEAVDPIEAFCVAWASSPAPDTPTLPSS